MNQFTRIFPSDFGPQSKRQTEADLKKIKDGKMNLITEWDGCESTKDELRIMVHKEQIESVTLLKSTNELIILFYDQTKLRFI
jgi:hypothetical protein